ncbi:MAG: ABC transporter permease [Acidobacteriota bacterium]
MSETLRSAFGALLANKLRSVLTTLGIVIGVAGVITVVSVVQGLQSFISQQFADLGAGTVMIMPNIPPGEEADKIGRVKLTNGDGLSLLESCPLVTAMTPVLFGQEAVKRGTHTTTTTVLGTTASYQDIVSHYVDRGRFFSGLDGSHRRRVCVPGIEVLKKLEVKGDPIGLDLQIHGEAFTIVGVMEEKGMFFGQSQDDFVFMPFPTAEAVYGKARAEFIQLRVKVKDTTRMDEAKDQMTDALRRRHALKPGQPDDFMILSQQEILKMSDKIFGVATMVVSGIAGIALLVGGIGIMNIMLVSVTERTREIGVRKAVGAARPVILRQFLIEAIVLCLLGGSIGIVLGYGAGLLAASLIPNFPPAHVPVWAVAVAFLFSSGVGVVFGVYPAYKAARLDPIEALRHE